MHFWRSNSNGDSDKPEDNYGNFDSDEEAKENSPTPFLKGKHFDIQAYASNYRRSIKILRLIFIADRCGDANERLRRMQLEALRITYDRAKKGKDVNVFTKIVGKINGRLGPNYDMDEYWCNSVIEARRVMSEMLQRCAKNCESSYKERTICEEDARDVFISIAVFYEDHGALTRAYAFYKQSVRFCRSDKNYSELLRRMIVVVIELGQFETVAKIAEEGMQYPNLNPITIETMRCALGLASFKAHRYKDAAHQFLGVSKELGNRFSEVMAAHDIAAFGALCALATFDPIEFKTSVVDNQNFHFYLDSALEVKELIRDFYLRRYCSCFRHLDNLREWLLIDIYFFNHFEILYDQIRKRALILYTEPFVAVGLQRMAVVFGTDIEAVEKELQALISTNQIQADIDSINKVVHLPRLEGNASFPQGLQSSGTEFDQVHSFVEHILDSI